MIINSLSNLSVSSSPGTGWVKYSSLQNHCAPHCPRGSLVHYWCEEHISWTVSTFWCSSFSGRQFLTLNQNLKSNVCLFVRSQVTCDRWQVTEEQGHMRDIFFFRFFGTGAPKGRMFSTMTLLKYNLIFHHKFITDFLKKIMGNTSIRNFHCSKIYYLEFMCVNLIYIGFASIPNFGLRTLGGSVSCGTSYTPKYQQALPRLCTVFLFIFNFSFFCVESSDFTGPKGWIPSFLLRGKLSPILIEKEKAFPLLASD